jgi:uncharacterized membrane protein YgcG
MCYGRRISATVEPATGKGAGSAETADVLQIRGIWEYHWTIMAVFALVALVCFLGVAWVWRTPGSENTLTLRLLLSMGGVLAIATGVFFIWAARSDVVIFDRSCKQWTMVRKTFPWDRKILRCCNETGSREGQLEDIASVFFSTRTRHELEHLSKHEAELEEAAAMGTPRQSSQQEGEKTGLLSGQSEDRKGVKDSAANGNAVSASSVSGNGSSSANGGIASASVNRSCLCSCENRTMAIRLKSTGRLVPLVEGGRCSWTALCCCHDHCDYLDSDTALDLARNFLSLGKH